VTPPTSPRDLTLEQFSDRIATKGVGFDIGPFRTHIRATVPALFEPLQKLYADFAFVDLNNVFSMHASVTPTRAFPSLRRQRVRYTVDGFAPHEDMPIDQALPVLEWGINLVIAMRSHHLLMLHSAVLEKHGRAIILPGAPGSGKSTLCAAMAHRGWRLLSDEFGLAPHRSASLVPVPRPIALKNESIDVFQSFAPDAFLGPRIPKTRKGTVAHVRPPTMSIRRQSELASARWVVFPRWQDGAALQWTPLKKAQSFMALASNAFNYELLGEEGFRTVRAITDACDSYSLVYSDLDDAISRVDEISARDGDA
jgi:HprK-related kinase A